MKNGAHAVQGNYLRKGAVCHGALGSVSLPPVTQICCSQHLQLILTRPCEMLISVLKILRAQSVRNVGGGLRVWEG